MQAKGMTNDPRYHQCVYHLQQAEQRSKGGLAQPQQMMPVSLLISYNIELILYKDDKG